MHKFDIKNIDKLDNPKRRMILPPEETLLRFDVKDDGILLDVGCGIGYFTIPASNILKSHKAIGIDIIPEIIEIAKDKSKKIHNIQFQTSGEYKFPIDDKSVDYILMSNVLHEVEDKVKYLKEVQRVKKENGCIIIIDWEKKETEMGPSIKERISKEDVSLLCFDMGFKLIKEIDISNTYYGLKFM